MLRLDLQYFGGRGGSSGGAGGSQRAVNEIFAGAGMSTSRMKIRDNRQDVYKVVNASLSGSVTLKDDNGITKTMDYSYEFGTKGTAKLAGTERQMAYANDLRSKVLKAVDAQMAADIENYADGGSRQELQIAIAANALIKKRFSSMQGSAAAAINAMTKYSPNELLTRGLWYRKWIRNAQKK